MIGGVATAASGWLQVAAGNESGRRIVISDAPVVIGRSRESSLYVPHDTVSRRHCVVWRDDAGFHVCDLGSTNGTRVNGAMVQEAAVQEDERIRSGAALGTYQEYVEIRCFRDGEEIALEDMSEG